ncbi:MAG: hypothetical protein LQ341_005549 [Variospora aurantia]|nr:MAG: hypothetical protein LQ341_005549 [Variospora aurantia]
MEVAGFALSVAGLVTLFDACLHGFDLLEQGKDFSRDHAVLLTRLDAQRAIFAIWGSAIGLSGKDDGSCIDNLLDSDLRFIIKGHLECISIIFGDAAQLSQKYGLKPRKGDITRQISGTQSGLPLRSYLRWFQKQTSYRRKAKWVIRDLAKFKNMLDDLSKLITELRDITSTIADLRRQRDIFVNEMAECTDVDDMEIIEEALSAEDPALSTAASERRLALTEAAMTVRSFPISHLDHAVEEDMETHADSDDDNLSLVAHDTASTTGEMNWPNDEQNSLEILTEYGHQNNLIESQKKDREETFWFQSRYCSIEKPDLSHQATRNIMKQLHLFQLQAQETPFISIGFADNVDGLEIRLVRNAPSPPWSLLTLSRIVSLEEFKRQYVTTRLEFTREY